MERRSPLRRRGIRSIGIGAALIALLGVCAYRNDVDRCLAAEISNAGHWLLHEEPERTSNQMIEFFREP